MNNKYFRILGIFDRILFDSTSNMVQEKKVILVKNDLYSLMFIERYGNIHCWIWIYFMILGHILFYSRMKSTIQI